MNDEAKAPAATQTEIEAEIARTRAELRATVDQLSERLDPRAQTQYVLDEARLALSEVKRKVTGEVRPADEPEPTRTGWVVLGVGAVGVVGAALLVAAIVRKF
jgi:hypothetical protein